MTAQKTSLFNAFETQLSASVGAADLTFNVDTTAPLTSPCYLVIDPTSASKREYVLFDGTFTSTAFVTSSTANRGLGGSAAGAQAHAAGTTVRCVPMHQHFGDLNDRIDLRLTETESNAAYLGRKSFVFDVTAYGATGDGTTDDTAAVQAAIDAAETRGTGIVWFPEGIYLVTGLTVVEDITLAGVGGMTSNAGAFGATTWSSANIWGSVIKSAATSGAIIDIDNATQVNLRSFVVWATGDNTRTTVGIDVGDGVASGATAAHWSDVTVLNCATGIRLRNVFECQYDKLTLRGCSKGLETDIDVNANTFIQLAASGCTSALYLDNAVSNSFYGATMQGGFGTSIDIVYGEDNIFDSMYFENASATYSVRARSGDFNEFRHVHLGDVGDDALIESNGNLWIAAKNVTGRTLTLATGTTENVVDAENMTITDNGTNLQRKRVGKRLVYTGDLEGGGLQLLDSGSGNRRIVGSNILSIDSSRVWLRDETGGTTYLKTDHVAGAVTVATAATQKVGFYGASPVVKPAALTASDASVVDATYGAEEEAVIKNLRTRVNELESKLQSLGLLT